MPIWHGWECDPESINNTFSYESFLQGVTENRDGKQGDEKRQGGNLFHIMGF
jgi:hypothetical protein